MKIVFIAGLTTDEKNKWYDKIEKLFNSGHKVKVVASSIGHIIHITVGDLLKVSTDYESARKYNEKKGRKMDIKGRDIDILGVANRPNRLNKNSSKVQSLLFAREKDWNPKKAKKWAKERGYKYGKVDETERYERLRQFDPTSVRKATIPFGKDTGIKSVMEFRGNPELVIGNSYSITQLNELGYGSPILTESNKKDYGLSIDEELIGTLVSKVYIGKGFTAPYFASTEEKDGKFKILRMIKKCINCKYYPNYCGYWNPKIDVMGKFYTIEEINSRNPYEFSCEECLIKGEKGSTYLYTLKKEMSDRKTSSKNIECLRNSIKRIFKKDLNEEELLELRNELYKNGIESEEDDMFEDVAETYLNKKNQNRMNRNPHLLLLFNPNKKTRNKGNILLGLLKDAIRSYNAGNIDRAKRNLDRYEEAIMKGQNISDSNAIQEYLKKNDTEGYMLYMKILPVRNETQQELIFDIQYRGKPLETDFWGSEIEDTFEFDKEILNKILKLNVGETIKVKNISNDDYKFIRTA